MKFSERSIPPQKFHACSRITIGCTGVKVKIEAPICDDVNAAIFAFVRVLSGASYARSSCLEAICRSATMR